jgi:excisionase family DNA binding protein
MENDAPVKLLSRRHVAEMLGVSERTVVRLTKQGVLPVPLHVGRAVRWPEADILSAIRRLSQSPSTVS